ncbi:hypothetical protein [Streptomyces sp. NPDC097610]|uniref:hypothetical protein n=1 Tax=Streptomyces sp. NPDC097610 TaxID=3157227 RepID=UPI003324F301
MQIIVIIEQAWAVMVIVGRLTVRAYEQSAFQGDDHRVGTVADVQCGDQVVDPAGRGPSAGSPDRGAARLMASR